MNQTTAIFFELLQVAIGQRQCLSAVPSDEEWQALYQMAKEQSLLGVLFHGIQRANLHFDQDLLLKWYSVSEQIKLENLHTNKAAVKLTRFFAKKGFRTCILKGQSNLQNYPDPYIRTSGDIDVWVEGGQEKVLPFAQRYVPADYLCCYHHIEFKPMGDIEIEVHYRPSFMNSPIHNRRLQRWFTHKADGQFSHQVELPDGVGRICTPTNVFNRIFQMAHISNHFFHEGIGLRQILDYYFVLQQGFTDEERQHDERLLKHLGLYKMATAVMFVLRDVLCLEPRLMIVPADERLGRFLLDEILQAGNFGQYDRRVEQEQGRLAKNVQRIKRDIRLVSYFPSECLWEPVFRWYHFFWRLRYKNV